MKKIFVLLVLVATNTFANDLITMKTGIVFNHLGHQTTKVGDCSVCHETKPYGKIPGFGKEWAHKYCTDCHEAFNEGPTKCAECHKK
ncbi:MAG: cytochrome c3 family protein [Pedobacter sp.]